MDVETAEAIATLGDRIDALLGSLRSEFGPLARTRRHAEVLFESLQDDIRILAEGFATLTAKLDSGTR